MNRLYLKVIIPTYLSIFLPKTDFLWYFSVKKSRSFELFIYCVLSVKDRKILSKVRKSDFLIKK